MEHYEAATASVVFTVVVVPVTRSQSEDSPVLATSQYLYVWVQVGGDGGKDGIGGRRPSLYFWSGRL